MYSEDQNLKLVESNHSMAIPSKTHSHNNYKLINYTLSLMKIVEPDRDKRSVSMVTSITEPCFR